MDALFLCLDVVFQLIVFIHGATGAIRRQWCEVLMAVDNTSKGEWQTIRHDEPGDAGGSCGDVLRVAGESKFHKGWHRRRWAWSRLFQQKSPKRNRRGSCEAEDSASRGRHGN